jgi:hypothetical protein
MESRAKYEICPFNGRGQRTVLGLLWGVRQNISFLKYWVASMWRFYEFSALGLDRGQYEVLLCQLEDRVFSFVLLF